MGLFKCVDCIELYVGKWSNEYVIFDMTRGRYVTDNDGNIIDIK